MALESRKHHVNRRAPQGRPPHSGGRRHGPQPRKKVTTHGEDTSQLEGEGEGKVTGVDMAVAA